MRVLDPVQVLSIVIGRMEQRASALEGVHMQGYEQTAMELRKFSEMLKRARSYVAGQRGSTGKPV